MAALKRLGSYIMLGKGCRKIHLYFVHRGSPSIKSPNLIKYYTCGCVRIDLQTSISKDYIVQTPTYRIIISHAHTPNQQYSTCTCTNNINYSSASQSRGGLTCVHESLQVLVHWPGRYHVTANDICTHVGPPL